jgi:predicted nuclease of predicted toxin-antitoxin system
MKFLLDESAEYRLASFLTGQGHDVTAIAHDYPAAIADSEVLGIAASEQRVVVTNDADFGELVFRHGHAHSGVILFRLPAGDTTAKIEALRKALASGSLQPGRFIVIDRRGVRAARTRPPPPTRS